MKSIHTGKTVVAIAIAALLGGCAGMDKHEGTAAGAAGGAVAGAVVGGPVGAVVGGVGGAYVGHETSGQGTASSSERSMTTRTTPTYNSSTVRAAQQALNSRGYNVGAIDGQYGASTQEAVRRFQQASGLPANGELTPSTLSALGVS